MASNYQDYEILLKIRADINDAIGALGKVNKSIKDTHTVAQGVSGALKNAAVSLAGFIGLGAALNGLRGMFESIFQKADGLSKLAQQTGLSTDAIQALGEAARETNVQQDALASGLNKFTQAIGKARTGSSQALQPFNDLRINFAEFQKLSPDKQLALVAQKLAQVKNPADEARVGIELFGKQFQDLKPAIEAAADQGLQHFIDKIKELGVYMSPDLIARMKAVADQANDVKTKAQGVATEFLSGFVPALQEGMDSVIKATSGATNGFQTLGEWIGTAFKSVLLVIEDVGAAIGIITAHVTEDFQIRWETTIKNVGTYFEGLKKNFDLLMHGHFVDAASNSQSVFAQIAAQTKDAQRRLAAMPSTRQAISDAWDENSARLFPGAAPDVKQPTGKTGTGDTGTSTGDLKQLLAARNALLQTELENELKLYEAQAKLRQTQEQADYEQGRVSLAKYFGDRRGIIEGQYALEIKALQARQAQVAAMPVAVNDQAGALQKQNQLAQAAGALQQKELERQQALLSLTLERQQAERQLFQDKLTAEAKIAILQGNRVQAERDLLQIELQQLDLQLRKAGTPDAEREQALGLAKSQGMAKADFDEAQRQADAAMNSLNTAIAAVNNKVANGQLFAINGEQQIAAIEAQRLPKLQQIAQAMLAAAQATGDPQMIAQAEAFNQKLQEVATSADLVGQRIAQFKQDAQDAFQGGLYNFLTTGITQAHSLGDAFRSLGLDIARSMEAAAAKQLALLATQKLFSLFNKQSSGQSDMSAGATKVGTASLALGVASVVLGTNADKLQAAADALIIANTLSLAGGFAEGGYTGPGAVNQIAGFVHAGEVVFSQSDVARHGGAASVEALRLRGYADGGFVHPLANAPTPAQLGFRTPEPVRMPDAATLRSGARGEAQGTAVGVRIVNSIDPEFATSAMNSAAGEKVIMNVLSRNATKLKQMVR